MIDLKAGAAEAGAPACCLRELYLGIAPLPV